MELLSPAGSYAALIGAVHAGADAVYFGGDRFSARAFADNLTIEQAETAISYAHISGVRCYLTINTLVREDELDDVVPFLAPYVAAGIDAVLVQDLGVLSLIRERYPGLEIHASTQMAVTGIYGARMLKEMGVKRIVPARELTLAELGAIRQQADIEVEAFVHGAMCYCYSGLCLFSGLIGGRSGNRGRCAQACRMPYHTAGEEASYPLSMKDLRTLQDIPALFAAGIDAFKIEGRMKKPAYAAGVTSVYRKYIDRFTADPEGFFVEEEDLRMLSLLYLRSETSDGYLHGHNRPDMVTRESPAYLKTDEALLEEITERYVTGMKTSPVTMCLIVTPGEEARLTAESRGASVTVTGETVQRADRAPLGIQEVQKQLAKLGGTPFHAEKITAKGLEEGVFLPVSALNALRRDAAASLAKEIGRRRMRA